MKKVLYILPLFLYFNTHAQSQESFLMSIREKNITKTYTTFSNTNFFKTYFQLKDYLNIMEYKKVDSVVLQNNKNLVFGFTFKIENENSIFYNDSLRIIFTCNNYDSKELVAVIRELQIIGSSKLIAIIMDYYPETKQKILNAKWGNGHSFSLNIYQDNINVSYTGEGKDGLTTVTIKPNGKFYWSNKN